MNIMELTVEILEEKFDEYNKLYFGGRLWWPDEFRLHKSFRCFGWFRCNQHSPGSRLRNVIISISRYYDWTEEHLRNVLVHEMLHYKIESSRRIDKNPHVPRFLKLAAEMNKKYGLNIEVHPKLYGLKVSASAPKYSLARLFAPPSH